MRKSCTTEITYRVINNEIRFKKKCNGNCTITLEVILGKKIVGLLPFRTSLIPLKLVRCCLAQHMVWQTITNYFFLRLLKDAGAVEDQDFSLWHSMTRYMYFVFWRGRDSFNLANRYVEKASNVWIVVLMTQCEDMSRQFSVTTKLHSNRYSKYLI